MRFQERGQSIPAPTVDIAVGLHDDGVPAPTVRAVITGAASIPPGRIFMGWQCDGPQPNLLDARPGMLLTIVVIPAISIMPLSEITT